MKCPTCGHEPRMFRRMGDVYETPEARKHRWAMKVLLNHRHDPLYPAVLEGLASKPGDAGMVFAWEMIDLWDNQLGRAPEVYPWEKRG